MKEPEDNQCRICLREDVPPVRCVNCPCSVCLQCIIEWHKRSVKPILCSLHQGIMWIPYDCVYCQYGNTCPTNIKVTTPIIPKPGEESLPAVSAKEAQDAVDARQRRIDEYYASNFHVDHPAIGNLRGLSF